MWYHNQWEQYVMHEVYPFMRYKNWNTYTILTGASFGAFLAVNFALKHPEYANKVVAMAGGYDTDFFGGYHSSDVYFNSPLEYIPNMHDHYALERIRAIDWKLVTSTWDIEECRETTIQLSQKMWSKGIWNQRDIWNDAPHDWPAWHRMVRVYL
jgi:esterase/lipase superfamily enzyme